jgi:hypothetical protein
LRRFAGLMRRGPWPLSRANILCGGESLRRWFCRCWRSWGSASCRSVLSARVFLQGYHREKRHSTATTSATLCRALRRRPGRRTRDGGCYWGDRSAEAGNVRADRAGVAAGSETVDRSDSRDHEPYPCGRSREAFRGLGLRPDQHRCRCRSDPDPEGQRTSPASREYRRCSSRKDFGAPWLTRDW